MAWTSPKTWSSEPLTSLDLNTYMRDNQNHLKDRLDASASQIVSGLSELSSTSNAFVDVDATRLALTLTTHGGDVLLGFTGAAKCSRDTGAVYFNVAVDGANYIADDGIVSCQIAQSGDSRKLKPFSFVLLITGLSAGQHTFKLRWKASNNNTVSMDIVKLHPQFWAKEI